MSAKFRGCEGCAGNERRGGSDQSILTIAFIDVNIPKRFWRSYAGVGAADLHFTCNYSNLASNSTIASCALRMSREPEVW